MIVYKLRLLQRCLLFVFLHCCLFTLLFVYITIHFCCSSFLCFTINESMLIVVAVVFGYFWLLLFIGNMILLY